MAKQKKDLSLIVWAFGWLLALATSLKKYAADLKVPFEAFERLGSPEGEATLQKVVALIRDEWAALQPKVAKTVELAVGHYRAFVGYAAVPSMAELEKEFGKNRVSSLFDGREWRIHASCVGMNETPGEKEFWVRHFGREIDSEEVIVLADKDDYRPATHLEAVEFARAEPELQKQLWIVALGSFALSDGDGSRYVAVLSAVSDGRRLGDSWFGRRWSAGSRFLLVRK